MIKLRKMFSSFNNISKNAKTLLLYGTISATIMLLFGIFFCLKSYGTFDYGERMYTIICGKKAAETFLIGCACAFVTDIANNRQS